MDRGSFEKVLNGVTDKGELRIVTFERESITQPTQGFESCVTHDGRVYINQRRMEALSKDYSRMRKEFQRILKRFAISAEEFLSSETTANAVPPNRKRSSRLN
jgi:hypothetical protein